MAKKVWDHKMRYDLLNVDLTFSLPFSRQLFFCFLSLHLWSHYHQDLPHYLYQFHLSSAESYLHHSLSAPQSPLLVFFCLLFFRLKLCLLFLRWSSNLRFLLSLLLYRVIFLFFVTLGPSFSFSSDS